MPEYDGESEQDRRHAARDAEQIRISTEKVLPVVHAALRRILEMNDEQLIEWRDSTKATVRERRQREERKQMSIMELVKWAVGAAAGGALTWLMTHQSGGGK